MLLAGCAGSSPPSLAVAVPPDCEAILQRVPTPAAVKPGDDLGAAVARRGAALSQANGRIDKGRACVANVRKAEAAK